MIKPITNPKDLKAQADALTLFTILAMGKQEIDQGRFRDAEAVFSNLNNADLVAFQMNLKP